MVAPPTTTYSVATSRYENRLIRLLVELESVFSYELLFVFFYRHI